MLAATAGGGRGPERNGAGIVDRSQGRARRHRDLVPRLQRFTQCRLQAPPSRTVVHTGNHMTGRTTVIGRFSIARRNAERYRVEGFLQAIRFCRG